MMHDPSLAPHRSGQSTRQSTAGRRLVGALIGAAQAWPPLAGRPASAGDLRDRAHGAYHEVIAGGGDAALDAALDVYKVELCRLRAELSDLRESLKLIRSYSDQAWLREVADHALTACPAEMREHLPVWLFDPDLPRFAEAEAAR